MTTEDLRQALGQIQGELKGLRESVEAITRAHDARLNAHRDQLRSLELWRAGLAGGGAVLAVLVTYVLWAVSFVWGP